MGLHETNKFEEVLLNKKDKQLLKKKILEDKHKSILKFVDEIELKKRLKIKKKPFFKLGLILIFVSIISLLIMNFIPWAVVSYDNKTSNLENNEIYYYINKIEKNSYDSSFSNFFDSQDSFKYLGLNFDSINSSSTILSYLLFAIILIGTIFTIFGLLISQRDFSIEKYRLLHCFFAFITALICIYIVFILIKFIGANILILYNNDFISTDIENLAFIFISPIIVLFIILGLFKLNISILKINYNIFEKNYLIENTKNKSLEV